MTDPDLLAKKLAFVETCVADLRRLAVAETSAPTSRSGASSSTPSSWQFRRVWTQHPMSYPMIDEPTARDAVAAAFDASGQQTRGIVERYGPALKRPNGRDFQPGETRGAREG